MQHITQKIQEIMGVTLLIGMFCAIVLVGIGGIFYLIQSGSHNLHSEIWKASAHPFIFKKMAAVPFSLSALDLIEIGLFILVITQILRVLLLAIFYTVIHDYWFMGISFFILAILIYSFIFAKA